MASICNVPLTTLLNPLKMAPDFRDYWGDVHAKLTALTDPIVQAECYQPRVFHAPSNDIEAIGLEPGGYLEYMLALPAGSFILAWLHSTLGRTAAYPPGTSSFTMQVTDIGRNMSMFQKPVPESFFLNDSVQPTAYGPFSASGLPYATYPSPRLLTAPYPVGVPNLFKFEFWNQLTEQNTFAQMSLLVAVPLPELLKK